MQILIVLTTKQIKLTKTRKDTGPTNNIRRYSEGCMKQMPRPEPYSKSKLVKMSRRAQMMTYVPERIQHNNTLCGFPENDLAIQDVPMSVKL